MRLTLTDDERSIKDLFGGFFEKESTPETVRGSEPLGFDPGLWATLAPTGAAEMATEGASFTDLALVAEEIGRRIAPVPLVEHWVVSRLLGEAPDGIATLALRPAIDGVARLVPAGAVADVVVGVDDGRIVAVRSAPPGTGPRNTADMPLADRDLRSGEQLPLPEGADAAAALAEWKALTAMALVGIGNQALAMGVEYVMERHQFEVPVGSFQAVQHGLADVAVRMDGATYLAHKAAWAVESGRADADRWASMAFLFCGEAAQSAAAAALQYHGGYGFAEEYDIQLYYRRAKGWMLVAGPPGEEYQRLADQIVEER